MYRDSSAGAVEISWDARSLEDFEGQSLSFLSQRYDLMAIDHPLLGAGVSEGALLPLDEIVTGSAGADTEQSSIGPNQDCYRLNGTQWAMPIDASTQMSAIAADIGSDQDRRRLLEMDVLTAVRELPSETIALPLKPTHLLCLFFALCAAPRADEDSTPDSLWLGSVLPERLQDRELVEHVAESIRTLAELVNPASYSSNPIDVLELMSAGKVSYVPVIYGYSTYSHDRHPGRRAVFGGLPTIGGVRPRPVLGGVGLAVSSHCEHQDVALDYTARVAGAEWQRTVFADADGQPAHPAAWADPRLDDLYGGFFRGTAEAMRQSIVRPRGSGYPEFQRSAGELLHRLVVRDRASAKEIADEMIGAWARSGLAGSE